MNPDSRNPSESDRPYLRSSQRLNSQANVRIDWTTPAGESFSEIARTLNISRAGCMVVVSKDIALNQRVRLTNIISGDSTDAIVIWKGPKPLEGYECGLELLVPPHSDFWGLDELM